MKKLLTNRIICLCLLILGLGCLFLAYDLVSPFRGSWQKLTEDKHSHALSFDSIVFFNPNDGLALTPIFLYKTSDGGKTWETAFENDGIATYSFVFTDKTNGWIVGAERKKIDSQNEEETHGINPKNHKPLILKTENAGLNWEKIDISQESSAKIDGKFGMLSDICFDKSGTAWLAGDGGIIEAEVSKQTWKVLNVFPMEERFDISCSDSGDIWAVGFNGTILRYQNGWTQKTLNVGKDVNDLTFFKKVKSVGNEVWVVGGSRPKETQPDQETHIKGVLFRSQDNGKTWENKTPASADGLFDIYFDGKNGWLIGERGSLYYTNDDGNSWMKEKTLTENDLLSIFFLNSNMGWISGERATVLKFEN